MMGYRLLFGMIVCGATSITCAAPLTPAQQAFANAQALAAGAQAGAAANVSGGSVATTVNQFNPTYYNSNGTAPESALFQNGNGNTVSAGQTKTADCQNGAPNPDPVLRQNCEAINLMVRNPSNRPQIAIPPSLLAPSKAIVANANTLTASSLGVADPNAVGAFSGCVNKTVGPPPTTKICSEFKGTAAQQCTVGRVVIVDEFTNYKCDKTVNTYLPQTCDRTLQVTITQPTPTAAIPVYITVPGTWVLTLNFDQNIGRQVNFSTCDTTGQVLADFWDMTGRSGVGGFTDIFYLGGCAYSDVNGCAINVMSVDQNGTSASSAGPYCPNASVISSYTCPAGSTLTGTGINSMCVKSPVVSSAINNGCTVQEAAAL